MERAEFEYWKPRDVARLLSLVEAERRYFQEMMAVLPVGVALASPGLQLTLTNRAFRKVLGLERQDTAGRKLDELVGVPSLGEHVSEVLRTGQTHSLLNPVAATPRGARALLVTLQPFREWDDDASPEVLVTLEDVSDIMGAKAPPAIPVREIEAGETAVPEAPVPAAAVAAPPAAAETAPPPPAPAAESGAAALAPPVFEGILWRLDPATMRFHTVHSAGPEPAGLPFDAWRTGAEFLGGRVVPAHLPLVKTFYELVLKGVDVRTCEYRAATTTGRTLWLRDTVQVHRNEAGEIDRIDGSSQNVTGLRQREDSVTQAVKVDALSRLAGRVAHECNNLLTILGGHGEELLHSLSPDNPLRSNAQEILLAGDRLSAFTQQLYGYVRHPSPDAGPVQLDQLVNDFRSELRQILPSSIRLIVNTGATNAATIADASLLVHALRTLALRGAEAMRGEGTLTVETALVTIPDATASSRAATAAGNYLQLSVRDTGHAIHPDLMLQLFEPPPSAEPVRHNLAAIYKAVREMGGDMVVTSEFDRGTCFQLLTPRGADVADRGALPEAAPPEHRMETILVVEDEAGIRGLIRRILSRQGYEILEAANGVQALEAARAHSGPIDMLLTDVVMPEMGGFDLARNILAERPDIRVLFISGYTGLSGFDPSQLPAGSAFLQKPFTLNALLAKVHDMFNATRR